MGILVVGSVAFDSVRTPFGQRDHILGGSATYFSMAAKHFTPVSLVAVVGDDFPDEEVAFFQTHGVDIDGLQRQRGKTFHWKGEYGSDLNTAKTLETHLNVFADFSPNLLDQHRSLEYLFLGNIDPRLQRLVLSQMKRPAVVACDTMNYWIDNQRESLLETLSLIDILLVNDAETRQLAEEPNLIKAARRILQWGPKTLIVKRGEYGVLMFNANGTFGAPAFPIEAVIDPTGAGDSFAGGFMGYLAASRAFDETALRRAVVFGSVMASFNLSQFGPQRLGELKFAEIENRFHEFRRLVEFEEIS